MDQQRCCISELWLNKGACISEIWLNKGAVYPNYGSTKVNGNVRRKTRVDRCKLLDYEIKYEFLTQNLKLLVDDHLSKN